jgi:hypothetical protein
MDSIKGLIPEIYYDMIARVAAGVPLVAILFSPSFEDVERVSNAATFILLLGFGYIAGHVLTAISTALNLVLWNPIFVRIVQNKAKLRFRFENYNTMRVFDVIYQRIDWAAQKDANSGAIMKKMEAGAALSDNLLSGWLVILAHQTFGGVLQWSIGLQSWNLSIMALVTGVLILSVYVRRGALIVRQDRLLDLLGYDETMAGGRK